MLSSFEHGNIPSIIEQNLDMEPFVIQGTAKRSKFFGDKYLPLQFVHLSDVHAKPELWERMTEYVDYYKDYISFALHTGDYCGASQEFYVDFYNECSPCTRPVLNCTGNHDTYKTREILSSTKETVHGLLFGARDSWGADFMSGDFSMTYCKDFESANVRLIVLDMYYGGDEQLCWLKYVLADAREKGYHVLTAAHEITSPITKKSDVTFNRLDDVESLGGNSVRHNDIEKAIVDFKARGGTHVCHLAGHEHSDIFGHTDSGILNAVVPCATDWDGWCDGKRVRGTRTYDCFNVVSVDVNQSLIKLIRIGNNTDHFLRSRRALCYDYANDRVISSC